MRRPAIAAAGFAHVGGVAIDLADAVHIAPDSDRSGRLLLVSVEPVDHSERGRELAAVALQTIQRAFTATPGPPEDGLLAAIAAANAAVIAQNRPLTTGRWQRSTCVGATVVATRGRQIAIVQTPPSQVILVQDKQVYAFPDLASWRGDYAPSEVVTEGQPLGFVEEVAPRLYVSEAAPGDLVLLCSTSLGRLLAHDEHALLDLYGGELLTSDLEGSVDRLERLAAEHDLADAFAVVSSFSRLSRRPRGGVSFRGVRLPASRQPAGVSRLDAAGTHVRDSDGLEIWNPVSGFRDWLVDTAELVSGSKTREPASIPRQRLLAAPGALSVHRYRESSGLSPELRAKLPRGPGLQVPARLLAVSLLLFVALGGTGVAMSRQKERAQQAAEALAAVDSELRAAVENQGVAMTAVSQAERALATAREFGADASDLARREAELSRLRDDVWHVRRLVDVKRIGALPETADVASARLALSNRTLYIAAGDLYELDAEQPLLVGLLAQGDVVGGAPVGRVTNVSIDGGDVVGGDGTATYRRDASGQWVRSELPVADVGGLRAGLPVITWGNASYGMSWDGDIVRFDHESGMPHADIWAAILDAPDLEQAKDLAVDGRIHVLIEDGRLLTFSRGALAGTMSAFVAPPVTEPAFIAEAPFASAYYVLDRGGTIGNSTGRVIRYGTNGDVWQYLAPEPESGNPLSEATAASLAAATDVAIDELSGTIYWISHGEIWQARLPAI